MIYPEEGAWADDPVHAQQLCEVLHRSHPEVMRDLEKLAMRQVVARQGDAIQHQTSMAYDEGHGTGYEQGFEDGKDALRGKIKEAMKEET